MFKVVSLSWHVYFFKNIHLSRLLYALSPLPPSCFGIGGSDTKGHVEGDQVDYSCVRMQRKLLEQDGNGGRQGMITTLGNRAFKGAR